MFIPEITKYLMGYLTITVTGRFCERFINVCAAKNILLWDIKRISPHSIRCKISVPAFRKLPSIAYHTGVHVHINIKHGFPFFVKKYKRRKIALFGVFVFLILVIGANQFVWHIEVTGNYKIPEEKILSVLNDSGLKIGTLRKKIDPAELKKNALMSIPELAWLWVDSSGSKVIVDVREDIETPEMKSITDYVNVTAKCDALIEKMTVRGGVPVVAEGDTVLAGTVLVTGKIPSSIRQDIRYVRADADVFARVWYEKCEVFSLISTTRHETGKHKTHRTLDFFGKKVNLLHSDTPPYENYDLTENTYSFFGIKLMTKKYKEVELQEELLSEETMADFGIAQIKKQLEEEVQPDSVLKSFDATYKVLNDTTIEVTVKAEYLENIAVSVKEEIPEGLN